MGCAGEREKIEDKMMLMKLERMEVQMEKEKTLKKLSEMEGRQIPFGHVPDYIDPKFAKDRNIYDDEADYKNADNDNLDTDDIRKKDKKEKKDKKDKKKEKSKSKSKEKDKKKDKKNKKEKKGTKEKDKKDKKEKKKK